MLKIVLVCAGKVKDRTLLGLEADYRKRMSFFAQTRVEEVTAAKSLSERPQESERLLTRARGADLLIGLDERGEEYSSQEFARFIESITERGSREICFLVGGAFGLSDECKQQCHALLSLSKMTFPHKLCRVFFFEQLYRASSILSGHPYHKD